MAIKRFVLAKEGPGEDPSKKRIEQLDNQIKQAQEQLKLAKEADSDSGKKTNSERIFNLQQRVNTLKTQRGRLKKRADDKKDNEKKVKDEKAATPCKRHGKIGCESTMCPESPNFNVLTTI